MYLNWFILAEKVAAVRRFEEWVIVYRRKYSYMILQNKYDSNQDPQSTVP